MIQKEIKTNHSYKIQISIWGKEETKELEGISKTELTTAIKQLVAHKNGIPTNKVFILEQVHGDTFYNTKEIYSQQPMEGDALYTTQTGEVLIVKTADCMPLFFWSETEQLIGIIHSGWKGTELGISEKVFKHLQKDGFSLDSIQAYIGPCARKDKYEVGEELYQKFKQYEPEAIEPKDNNKYLLGLNFVVRSRLIEHKLPIQFLDSGICTIENDQYHSHRRGDMGRNLNLIYMS